jgi:cytochrome c oxidase subunit 2
LRVPVNTPVRLRLRSRDVIHNFFVRELRIKQDAVPGMVIPVWFKAERVSNVTGATSAAYDLVCAELCGWGHYKMKGQLVVETRDEYERFLADLEKQQEATQ